MALRNPGTESFTVILPQDFYDQLYDWWSDGQPEGSLSAACERVISDALTKPEPVKRALSRAHLATQRLGPGKPFCASMSPQTWKLIDTHALRYGLPTRAEAFRELLRLGLGIPQPQPGVLSSGVRKKSPNTQERQRMILALDAQGMPRQQIGRTLGVSRAYVYRVLDLAGQQEVAA